MVGDQEQQSDPRPLPLPASALLESLLFVADEAVPVDRLATILEIDLPEVEGALVELQQEYQARGLRIQQKRQRVQIVTAPEASPYIQRFLGLELTGRLSPAALEALARESS